MWNNTRVTVVHPADEAAVEAAMQSTEFHLPGTVADSWGAIVYMEAHPHPVLVVSTMRERTVYHRPQVRGLGRGWLLLEVDGGDRHLLLREYHPA